MKHAGSLESTQEARLRIFRGEDSWWKLFDLATMQVPLKRIYPYSNVYFELV